MLRRPRTAISPPPDVPTHEVEVVDVTRIFLVLDTGLPLTFDIDQKLGHTLKHDTKWLTLTLGERVLRIASHRILYTDISPAKAHKVKTNAVIPATA